MSDRAAELARCLMEGGIRLPVGPDGKITQGSLRTFLDIYFPGISQDEVTRGYLIAVEIAKADKGASMTDEKFRYLCITSTLALRTFRDPTFISWLTDCDEGREDFRTMLAILDDTFRELCRRQGLRSWDLKPRFRVPAGREVVP